MSSKINLFFKVLFIVFVLLLISSCGKDDNNDKKIRVLSADSAASFDRSKLLDFARHKIGDLKFYEFGNYQPDSVLGLAAGQEIVGDSSFGIKFYLIKRENREYRIVFQSPELNGSFNEAMTRKFKLGDTDYDLIYYSSQDYFMGSGGGEIFSYIIDLNQKQVYYAHFFTVPSKPTSLYLSPNIQSEQVKEFFVKNFQKDYPELKVVTRDYNLENIF